jgi:hypothetical protein
MGRAFLFAIVIAFAAGNVAHAQPVGAPQCNDFAKLRSNAEEKALAVRAASQRKPERKEMCSLIQRFVSAESAMIKFLEANKVWCGVPDQAITQAKANHAKTLKVRQTACSGDPVGAAPRPKAPTLSEALGTLKSDTPENTKTGRGTFDTLTGNPLAR